MLVTISNKINLDRQTAALLLAFHTICLSMGCSNQATWGVKEQEDAIKSGSQSLSIQFHRKSEQRYVKAYNDRLKKQRAPYLIDTHDHESINQVGAIQKHWHLCRDCRQPYHHTHSKKIVGLCNYIHVCPDCAGPSLITCSD